MNTVLSASLRADSSAWRRFQSKSFIVIGEDAVVEGDVCSEFETNDDPFEERLSAVCGGV